MGGTNAIERGLNLEGWLDRKQRRGYESSPNTSEFNNLNELSNSRHVQHERKVLNFLENPIKESTRAKRSRSKDE